MSSGPEHQARGDEDADELEDVEGSEDADEFGEERSASDSGEDSDPEDVTDTLQLDRKPDLEYKLGVRFQCLSVSFQRKPYSNQTYDEIVLRGDVEARKGGKVAQSLDVVLTAYDERSRVIGTRSHWIDAERFEELDTFSIELPVYGLPARLRLFVRRS